MNSQNARTKGVPTQKLSTSSVVLSVHNIKHVQVNIKHSYEANGPSKLSVLFILFPLTYLMKELRQSQTRVYDVNVPSGCRDFSRSMKIIYWILQHVDMCKFFQIEHNFANYSIKNAVDFKYVILNMDFSLLLVEYYYQRALDTLMKVCDAK